MKEGKTLETFRLIAKIFLIISCVFGVFAVIPLILSIIGLKYLDAVTSKKRGRELIFPIIIAAFASPVAGVFLILDYVAHKDDEDAQIMSVWTLNGLHKFAKVLLIIGLFIFPVGTITSILGLKYLNGIQTGERQRNLVLPIVMAFLCNSGAGMILIFDYFAEKYDLIGKKIESKKEEVASKEAKADTQEVQGYDANDEVVEKYKAEQMVASKIYEKEFGVKEENNVPVTAPKKKSSTPRLIAYTAIIGGLTLGAVSLFTFSQYEMAKYKASKEVINSAGQLIEGVYRSDSTIVIIETDEKTDEKTYKLNTNVSDEKKESDLYKHAAYLVEVYNHFNIVKVLNNVFYVVTALPSYLLSMSALISVGLILNHSEKVKEKEEKEV